MATTNLGSTSFQTIAERRAYVQQKSSTGISHLDVRATYKILTIEEGGKKYADITKEAFFSKQDGETHDFPAFQVESDNGGKNTVALVTLRNKEEFDAFNQLVKCVAPSNALYVFDRNAPLEDVADKVDELLQDGDLYLHVITTPIAKKGKFGTFTGSLTVCWLAKS